MRSRGPAGGPHRRDAGGRRARDPAGIRRSQGDVLHRTRLGQVVVRDPRPEGACDSPALWPCGAAMRDDQSGDARAHTAVLLPARPLRAGRRRPANLLPGNDAGGGRGERPIAAGPALPDCGQSRRTWRDAGGPEAKRSAGRAARPRDRAVVLLPGRQPPGSGLRSGVSRLPSSLGLGDVEPGDSQAGPAGADRQRGPSGRPSAHDRV